MTHGPGLHAPGRPPSSAPAGLALGGLAAAAIGHQAFVLMMAWAAWDEDRVLPPTAAWARLGTWLLLELVHGSVALLLILRAPAMVGGFDEALKSGSADDLRVATTGLCTLLCFLLVHLGLVCFLLGEFRPHRRGPGTRR